MSKHSNIGASSAERWFNCPGSVALIEKAPPEEPSPYAEQGTAAHWVLEQCLSKDERPWNYLGEEAPNGVEIKEEDVIALVEAVDYVNELRGQGHFLLDLEVRFDLECIFPNLFGTADVVLISTDLDKLIVLDYKHGKGVAVFPRENKQLLYYGLGAIKAASDKHAEGMLELVGWGHVFKEVVIGVIQPRNDWWTPEKALWPVPPERLDKFAVELYNAAKRTQAKEAPLIAGDYCSGTWCPANVICPAPIAKAQEVAKLEFSPIDSPEEVKLPSPESLSKEDVVKIMKLKPMMINWFNSAFAYAQIMIENGEKFPGYKVVKTNPNRKWIDDDDMLETLGMVTKDEELYTKKLKSPAQMEALLGKKHKGMVADLCHKPEGKNTLAPEHDKRPAVECGPQTDFEKIER